MTETEFEVFLAGWTLAMVCLMVWGIPRIVNRWAIDAIRETKTVHREESGNG